MIFPVPPALVCCIGNWVSHAANPSGGCALRAKEIWSLKRPRFGARVRRPGLFIYIGNWVSHAANPSGGCALRAKEIWPLKRPRFGARVRRAGLFICIGNWVSHAANPSGGSHCGVRNAVACATRRRRGIPQAGFLLHRKLRSLCSKPLRGMRTAA